MCGKSVWQNDAHCVNEAGTKKKITHGFVNCSKIQIHS